MTKFLEEHPGGEEVLLEVAGKDASKEFDTIGHSEGAKKMLSKFQVGVLQGHSVQDLGGKDDATNESKKEMSAFVIKDDSSSTFKSLFLTSSFLSWLLLSILVTDISPDLIRLVTEYLSHHNLQSLNIIVKCFK